uniref:ribosomal protein L6 n=1 Tax=Haslea karadagensis TaxID=1146996 RepID=UPI00220528DA|nr:ribosomal protein L6 [Haslea karadagensis]UXN44272.1 ribosomal protein L6 [Haslea karadagensis]UXN44353.1 ribosomal protein L6 [Haslea karadagensis]
MDTSVFYCEKKKFLTVVGPFNRKSLKLKLKLLINEKKKILKVSSIPFFSVSNSEKKKLKTLRGTIVSLIKQILIETSTLILQKLKLHGMGYRVFFAENLKENALVFKLGYSHSVFFKLSSGLLASCFSRTQFSIFGTSYQDVTQLAAFIRSTRTPEPYKGKGVLYENEKVTLKEGKKV